VFAPAKEEIPIGARPPFIPNLYQEEALFSGETALELLDDNNGNLTLKTPKVSGPFTSYEYDVENKLIRVVMNGTTVSYKYDGLGRRIEKEINIAATTTTTRYIYDNEDILLELDGSNNITARYTHGPGIDEPLIMEKGGASFFHHADGLGTITELTDSFGAMAQAYTYSSFGKIESQFDPNVVQPYSFTGREFDPETGLHFYQARYYDPSVGRFLQQDPLGFGSGSLNFYAYVNNNPTIFTDPTGLKTSIGCRPVIGAGIFQHCFIRIVPEPGSKLSKLAERLGQESLTLSLISDNSGFLPFGVGVKEVNSARDLNVPAPFEVNVPTGFVSACEFDQAVFNEFLKHPNSIPYSNNPFAFNNSNTFVRRIIEAVGGEIPRNLPIRLPPVR